MPSKPRWQSGESGNPGGRPAISEYARNVVRARLVHRLSMIRPL